VIGQQHLLGPGKPLARRVRIGAAALDDPLGPAGHGKTTLARLMADAFDAQFIAMSAVLGGVKDIREAVERAQAARTQGRRPCLRRRGASLQQEPAGRVPAARRIGPLTFIGATTENPSFEVNSALLSRATVHVLKPLDDADLAVLLERAQALLARRR
jgi:putative ATPase